MKTSTIALVVTYEAEMPVLMDTLSDEREIHFMEEALRMGESRPLEQIYEHRAIEARQDDDLGNYIEELLSQTYLKPEIQKHGLQWLKSKIKIEQYQKAEKEAAQVIAEYAIKILREDPTKTDFFLTGPHSQV